MSVTLANEPVGGGQASLGQPGRGRWRQRFTGCDHIRFESRAIARLKPSPRRHDSDVMPPARDRIIGDRPSHVAFRATRGVDFPTALECRNVCAVACARMTGHGTGGRKRRIRASFATGNYKKAERTEAG